MPNVKILLNIRHFYKNVSLFAGQISCSLLYMGGVFINNNFSYAIFPLELITNEQYKGLSSDEKILYILLLNRKNSSKKNLKSFSDTKGVFIYYTNLQIQNHLNCSISTAVKILKNLEKAGLITKEYQKHGLPLKIYVNDINNLYSKPKESKSPALQEASFNIEKAKMASKQNRENFGEKKNKRRNRKNSSAL